MKNQPKRRNWKSIVLLRGCDNTYLSMDRNQDEFIRFMIDYKNNNSNNLWVENNIFIAGLKKDMVKNEAGMFDDDHLTSATINDLSPEDIIWSGIPEKKYKWDQFTLTDLSRDYDYTDAEYIKHMQQSRYQECVYGMFFAYPIKGNADYPLYKRFLKSGDYMDQNTHTEDAADFCEYLRERNRDAKMCFWGPNVNNIDFDGIDEA